ncbi:MAG: DNA helicase RecQ [Verrucomicrobiota bacterium]
MESPKEIQNQLESKLKEVFGYTSFRPYQLEIMESVMAGKDTFALLPTGGGKSLCYQIPALLMPGLTVVVSPLIALMKDQVDALLEAGVDATYVNSSLSAEAIRERMRNLHEGKVKLLYLAPERLLQDHWEQILQEWEVSLVAIDEAHCISEWGHDFRPEYRQIGKLRTLLPKTSFLALTATATGRVQEEIKSGLSLREPACFKASFNRPNLHYRVIAKQKPTNQVHQLISERPQESGIVYCGSRNGTETLAASLSERGHTALPYHAGLSSEERARNQDAFLHDEAKTICATIAFGMGIDKPNVRYVIHHDLPKNIESYYQETGRAGRDGLPSDCVLLYSAGDAAKQRYFIDQVSDIDQQQNQRKLLQQMIHYAESPACRRIDLLGYFGEVWNTSDCGACDNCQNPREWEDATIPSQKLLSCVFRVAQSGGYGTGLNHLIEILTGADTEKVRQRGHDRLSTYGIGSDFSRKEWQWIGRELIRLGYLQQTADKYSVVQLTEKAIEALKNKEEIRIAKALELKKRRATRSEGDIECDENLFDVLRTLRQSLAKDRGVPAYIIFGDQSLRLMAREYPTDAEAFSLIQGVGEKKAQEYTEVFTATITGYLENHPRHHFH